MISSRVVGLMDGAAQIKLIIAFFSMTALAQQLPTRILVVYHSDTGHTEKLARAVRQGAASVAGVAVTFGKTTEIKDEDILRSDGIALGTPVHWSNLSAETKRFLDHTGAVLWKAKTTGDGGTATASCTAAPVPIRMDP